MRETVDDEDRWRAALRRRVKRDRIRERRQWQDRSLTVRQAADRYEVSPTTIQKWRKRGTVQALPRGPRNPPRVLTDEERALVKTFYRCFRLSRQQTLDALLPLIPNLKLTTLKRILVRFKKQKNDTSGDLIFQDFIKKPGFLGFLQRLKEMDEWR